MEWLGIEDDWEIIEQEVCCFVGLDEIFMKFPCTFACNLPLPVLLCSHCTLPACPSKYPEHLVVRFSYKTSPHKCTHNDSLLEATIATVYIFVVAWQKFYSLLLTLMLRLCSLEEDVGVPTQSVWGQVGIHCVWCIVTDIRVYWSCLAMERRLYSQWIYICGTQRKCMWAYSRRKKWNVYLSNHTSVVGVFLATRSVNVYMHKQAVFTNTMSY